MLIGLRFPEPCLNTSVTLANLEEAKNFDELIHYMKSAQVQTFIGLYFLVFSPTTGKLRPEKVRIHFAKIRSVLHKITIDLLYF